MDPAKDGEAMSGDEDSENMMEVVDVKCLRQTSLQGLMNAQTKSIGSVFEIKELSWHIQQWDTPSISSKPLDLAKLHPYALAAFLPFGPVVDGDIVPNQLLPLLQNGKYHKMPLIMGSTRDEGCQYAHALFSPGMSTPQFLMFVNMMFSRVDRHTLQSMIKHPRWKPDDDFMLEKDGGNLAVMSNLITDLMFRCPISNMTRSRDFDAEDTYLYMYNHSLSLIGADKEEWGDISDSCGGRVPHGSDVPAFFNAFSLQDKQKKSFEWHITDKEKTLFHHMLSYWINFVKTGNPNGVMPGEGEPLPQWNAHQSDNGMQRMVLRTVDDGGAISGMTNEPQNGCDIFDAIGYYH